MASAREYAQWMRDNPDKEGTALYENARKGYGIARQKELKSPESKDQELTTSEQVMGHPLARFAKGAASMLTGPFQLGANIGDYAAEKMGLTPVVGKYVNEKLKELQETTDVGRKARGSEGFDWWELGGLLGSPANLLRTGVTKTPAVTEKVAETLLKKGGRLAEEGAKTGALYGAGMPVYDGGEDYATTKAIQTGTGAAGGAVLAPVITPAVKAVTYPIKKGAEAARYFARPFTEAGRMKDVGGVYRTLSGESTDDIVTALQNAGKTVSGDKQTAGQALAAHNRATGGAVGHNIAKMEQELSGSQHTGDAMQRLEASQAKGRSGIIDAIAGTPESQSANQATADINKQLLYGRAYRANPPLDRPRSPYGVGGDIPVNTVQGSIAVKQQPITAPVTQQGTISVKGATDRGFDPYKLGGKTVVSPDKTVSKTYQRQVTTQPEDKMVSKTYKSQAPRSIADMVKNEPELKNILSNPYVKKSMPDAENLAAAEGVTIESNPTRFLHLLKKSIDKQLNKKSASGETELAPTELAKLSAVKKQLTTWMGKKNPDYDYARTRRAEDMIPVDKQTVGKGLQKILTNPLEQEKGAAMVKAMSDMPKTIKKSGVGFYDDMNQIIPEHMPNINKITDELLNQSKLAAMQSEKGGVLSNLQKSVEPSLPNMLHRPTMLANFLLKKVGKDMGPEYERIAIELHKNPSRMAEILKLPDTDPTKRMAGELMNKVSAITAVSSAQEMRNQR